LTSEQFHNIWCYINNNILESIAEEQDIFKIYPEDVFIIFKYWEDNDKTGFGNYIKEIINKDISNTINVLTTYLPRRRALGDAVYYTKDFDKKAYDYFRGILDPVFFIDKLLNIYSEEELSSNKIIWDGDDNYQTPINVARQFLYQYNNDNSEHD